MDERISEHYAKKWRLPSFLDPEGRQPRDTGGAGVQADRPCVTASSGARTAASTLRSRLDRLTHMLQRQYILRGAHIRIERRSSISVRPSRDFRLGASWSSSCEDTYKEAPRPLNSERPFRSGAMDKR